MNNQRRRREVLLIASMLSGAFDVVKDQKYAGLSHSGPLPLLPSINKMWHRAVTDAKAAKREHSIIFKVVNDISHPDYFRWNHAVRLWVVPQLVMRLVASGWRPPHDPVLSQFFQEVYNLSNSLVVADLPEAAKQHVPLMVDLLRKRHGLFL